jgi:exonuclease SbcD
MRILHTGDLHLGRHFEGWPLDQDHRVVLEQLFQAVTSYAPDALIIAGDIFDRASPPESAVRQFNEFILRVASETKTAIVLIAGNHDSADRIDSIAMLSDRRRALVRGRLNAEEHPLVLQDAHGPVAFSALPFGHEFAARECFGTTEISSPADVLRAQIASARRHVPVGARWVVSAHVFVTGGNPSENERSLARVVGGIETVPPELFEGIHYVALGHLHRPQAIGINERIRYCGSPLAFGFDEEGNNKSMALVNLDRDGSSKIRLVPFQPLRQVRTLRGRLDDLIAKVGTAARPQDFVKIVLTDSERRIDPMKRIRDVYPNACSLTYERDEARVRLKSTVPSRLAVTDPARLIADFLDSTRGCPPSDAEKAIIDKELAAMAQQQVAA